MAKRAWVVTGLVLGALILVPTVLCLLSGFLVHLVNYEERKAKTERAEKIAAETAKFKSMSPQEHLAAMKEVISLEKKKEHLRAIPAGSTERSEAEDYLLALEAAEVRKEKERRKAEEEAAIKSYGPKAVKIHKKHPLWSMEDCKSVAEGKVHIGMTQEMCRESWGRPSSINNTHTQFGVHSQWCYGQFCDSALYFEGGILTTIQN